MSTNDVKLSDEELAALDFEEAQKRLEAVVDELERGQLSLDRGLALYELAMQLSKHCRQKLAAAEGALERLRELPDGGLATEEAE